MKPNGEVKLLFGLGPVISMAIVLSVHCLAATTGTAALLGHGILTPKWRTDLHVAVGGPLPRPPGGGIIEVKAQPITSLRFADDDRLLATFVVGKNSGESGLPRRGDADTPLQLRAIVLNGRTGQITALHDWPSDSRDAVVVATLAGKIVVKTGDEVSLYGSDFEKLKSIKLPRSPPVGWAAVSSLTEKNILFVRTQPLSESKQRLLSWIWIQTDTLEEVHSWSGQPNGLVSITDNEIALSTRCAYIGCEPTKLEVRGLFTDWRALGPGENQPYFVDEDTIFLSAISSNDKRPAQVIRTNGRLLFTASRTSDEGIWWTNPATSAEGSRFVAAGVQVEGGVAALDVSAHSVLKKILVYDLLSERSYVLDIKALTTTDGVRLALSPDGSRLAILNNEAVEMFELPSQR